MSPSHRAAGVASIRFGQGRWSRGRLLPDTITAAAATTGNRAAGPGNRFAPSRMSHPQPTTPSRPTAARATRATRGGDSNGAMAAGRAPASSSQQRARLCSSSIPAGSARHARHTRTTPRPAPRPSPRAQAAAPQTAYRDESSMPPRRRWRERRGRCSPSCWGTAGTGQSLPANAAGHRRDDTATRPAPTGCRLPRKRVYGIFTSGAPGSLVGNPTLTAGRAIRRAGAHRADTELPYHRCRR